MRTSRDDRWATSEGLLKGCPSLEGYCSMSVDMPIRLPSLGAKSRTLASEAEGRSAAIDRRDSEREGNGGLCVGLCLQSCRESVRARLPAVASKIRNVPGGR